MSDSKDREIIYRKLVRDRIPDLLEQDGKRALISTLLGEGLKRAVADKILEESYELFKAFRSGETTDVLKESADLVEIVAAGLQQFGLNESDLRRAREERNRERGAFRKGICLEKVGIASSDDYHIHQFPKMFVAPFQDDDLINLIKSELNQSDMAWIASAFYSPGITNLLLPCFDKFIGNDGKLWILLSTMGNSTPPEYFRHLREFAPLVNFRIFHPPEVGFDKSPPNFHVKAYLFHHRNGMGTMLIGSSNFTEAGFFRNIEWNYFSPGEVNLPFDGPSPFKTALDTFKRYWREAAIDVTDDFLTAYEKRREQTFGYQPNGTAYVFHSEKLELFQRQAEYSPRAMPNEAQKRALDNLVSMREQGIEKAAVVAATGIGKTYLAAFDFKQSDCRNLLYIAHRENILAKAKSSFCQVLGVSGFGENGENLAASLQRLQGTFAMVQTLSRKVNLEKYSPEDFDYIVMDEFHHSEADTYRRLLKHFRPKFFLGLTATPERMDGRDVLFHCDYNIAYELRLLDAVDGGFLAPFQYFAIYDETDYSQITWRGTGYDEIELDRALANDNRTAIIAHNLRKFLPSHGKIKALAFCSSVSHAAFTARQLSMQHGIESISLIGLSKESEREEAIKRLQDERDPLKVICSVDIFNEGIDIPELTHVLFLRPTQSFTIFLQQLGRGLRKSQGKAYLVAIDFVGNFRKAHVAPLALSGYTSSQDFAESYLQNLSPFRQLPRGCHLNADLEARKIWDEEIRKIVQGQLTAEDRLKMLYLEIKSDLGGRSLMLMDLYASTYNVDPHVFIRQFGNWLRTKRFCEGQLPDFENSLLDSPGEAFLEHIEKELNPVRSYKMVVLRALLNLPGVSWKIEDIALEFLDYFLIHRDRRFDYEDLGKSSDPDHFPLSKVVAKLKQMPLHFLSNADNDFFILDKAGSQFSLKPQVHEYWVNPAYRKLVADRVEYALARYFRRKGAHQAVFFDSEVLQKGLALDQELSGILLGDKKLPHGKPMAVNVLFGENRYEAELRCSENGKKLFVQYLPDSELRVKIADFLTPSPQSGEKVFYLRIEKDALRIEPAPKTADLRGIVVEIPYAVRQESGMTAGFRELFSAKPDAASWEIDFDKPGYTGDMDVEIRDGESFLAWTVQRFNDPTRFPARIKAAATALFSYGFRGTFHIAAKGKRVKIQRK